MQSERGSGMDARTEILLHNLTLVGCKQADLRRLAFVFGDDENAAQMIEVGLRDADGLVVVQPRTDLCLALGIAVQEAYSGPIRFFSAASSPGMAIRSLNSIQTYSGGQSLAVLTNGEHGPPTPSAVWLSVSHSLKKVLVLGSDVVRDLVRYRQGDPERTGGSRVEPFGGFSHPRANRLYSDLRAGESPFERHADVLADALASVISNVFGISRAPILPNSAPGAVVVTGDDDQAYLDRYEFQLKLLGDLPVTYFLHPLTRLNNKEMRRLFSGRNVELGLHPDSLDEPERYAERLAEQSVWFRELTGSSAVSVRNHGFLDAGYWDYVKLWEACGIRYSSNLSAADGTALNGSYLPSRMFLEGQLTSHWSILTTIGDGLLFAHKNSPEEAADKVRVVGQEIVGSRLPGVVVLNLHPQNVDKSQAMHRVVHELVDGGFHPWTVSECMIWFREREFD